MESSVKKMLDYDALIPQEYRDFNDKILTDAGVPPLPADERAELLRQAIHELNMEPEEVDELLEVIYTYPVKFIVSALGAPPKHVVERAHSLGIKVGALSGALKHAQRNKEAGVDILIAQGHEAGGHTGKITSMILWPELAEAMAPMPVLAAGGVGSGRQLAAALALGAAGAWCGTIWLGTKENNHETQVEKERLFAAKAADSVQSPHISGKPLRMVKSVMSEAWAQPGAPKPLMMPLQNMLYVEAKLRLDRAGGEFGRELTSVPGGQIVGRVNEETTVKEVIEKLVSGFEEAVQHLNKVAE